MNKLLLLTGLLLVCATSHAEWRYVGSNARADYYIEAESIRKDGDRRQVLEMLDLKTADSQGNRSYLALYEYECPTAPVTDTADRLFRRPDGRRQQDGGVPDARQLVRARCRLGLAGQPQARLRALNGPERLSRLSARPAPSRARSPLS